MKTQDKTERVNAYHFLEQINERPTLKFFHESIVKPILQWIDFIAYMYLNYIII